jgi:hypothetical protein
MTDTYLGAEQVLTDLFVIGRLAAFETEFEAIDAGLSDRIFQDFAPVDTEMPYIIYQCQDPPRDVRGVGPVRVMVDTLYIVKAVAQVATYAPLAPVAKVIDAAMTVADVTPVDDGYALASIRNGQFSLTEIDSGKKFCHLGGEYRIQAQAHQ